MKIRVIEPGNADKWPKLKQMLLRFVTKYGDGRITTDAFDRLAKLAPEHLRRRGTQIVTATVSVDGKKRLVGFSFVSDFGRETCIVIVHPDYRKQEIGTKLLLEQTSRLGQLMCQVALDNAASIQMCFKAGLVAAHMSDGPTGKPTFHFESRPVAVKTAQSLTKGSQRR
ncbi:hypothetical protein PAE9249_00225 [Paenibacillus sp. CECT 9249]|uniref:GNAT family N-acetyltransferase n=1 Tax=Paenibacillus sp. CECT 9249 TaxID=2845385 RepID=UPI001E63E1DE|nr:GNAT family N-acetyltransferase [Paenibacillus sp. CECT 9249]CAH0117764.1 hypothetical protein PAE9249_00225 [Paenibacillus sp. CECT 9249]